MKKSKQSILNPETGAGYKAYAVDNRILNMTCPGCFFKGTLINFENKDGFFRISCSMCDYTYENFDTKDFLEFIYQFADFAYNNAEECPACQGEDAECNLCGGTGIKPHGGNQGENDDNS